MEFDRVGIEGEAVFQGLQRFVVPSLVVELVGLFIEVVGAEKGIRHPAGLP
jgi:hypothetical protein